MSFELLAKGTVGDVRIVECLRGPRTDPCGTPHVISTAVDLAPKKETA